MKIILKLIVILFIGVTLANDLDDRKERIESMETKTSEEAMERKASSESILKQKMYQ